MKSGGGASQEPPKTQERTEYAVQCAECFKWRLIPTKEEFEDIRSRFIEDPWLCSKKPDVSCEDPADIEYGNKKLWAIDKPNLPKPPVGYERILVLRKDFSKFDAYYITPTGKRVRAPSGIEKFLEENPKYKGVTISDFNFAVPKIMEDTIPKDVDGKNSANSSKRMTPSINDDDDDDD
ncbi:methyl-CpG-binding domain-containing protein 4-like [Macadamia integrifolia]|uniref:methyl-CpG-binding domain-containing protein 4-like n=1 Tax=Macadamia integrifolia TaxID=60698 RepID=UPI001C50242B|nr:methyl-CpG-binding domain-containing protein 4-like [Macadamia integrifolia]